MTSQLVPLSKVASAVQHTAQHSAFATSVALWTAHNATRPAMSLQKSKESLPLPNACQLVDFQHGDLLVDQTARHATQP